MTCYRYRQIPGGLVPLIADGYCLESRGGGVIVQYRLKDESRFIQLNTPGLFFPVYSEMKGC
jgi:hypothetical protein